MVTFVAFAAVTESVDAAPAATVFGVAEMLTVGAGIVTLPLTPPHPASKSARLNTKNLRETNWRTLAKFGDTGAFLFGALRTRKTVNLLIDFGRTDPARLCRHSEKTHMVLRLIKKKTQNFHGINGEQFHTLVYSIRLSICPA